MASLRLVFELIVIPGPDDNLRDLGEEMLVFCGDALTEYGVVARKECQVINEPQAPTQEEDIAGNGIVREQTEADIILGNAFDGLER
jgi:hypothetical protein